MIGYAFYVCYSARIVCLLFSHGVTLSVLSHHTICTRFCEHIKLSAKSKVFSVCSSLLSLFSPWKGLGHSLSLSLDWPNPFISIPVYSLLLGKDLGPLSLSHALDWTNPFGSVPFYSPLLGKNLSPLSLTLWTGQILSVLFQSTLLCL